MTGRVGREMKIWVWVYGPAVADVSVGFSCECAAVCHRDHPPTREGARSKDTTAAAAWSEGGLHASRSCSHGCALPLWIVGGMALEAFVGPK
jgi:hypothetical protein